MQRVWQFVRVGLVGVGISCAALVGQQRSDPGVSLLDRVAEQLSEHYLDRSFCDRELPELLARFRDQADRATSPAQERAVVHALLAQVPASHLALLSRSTHQWFEAELFGQPSPMLGCSLVRIGEKFYIDSVYAGGPAAEAGLRRGEEVLAICGEDPLDSPWLDWRSDDAHLTDPASYRFVVIEGQVVELQVGADRPREVALVARPWSALRASSEGVRELPLGNTRALYVPLWFVYHERAARLLAEALRAHPDCGGLLLDLRGRGGSALECAVILRVLHRAKARGLSIVALTDSRTRSAKEILALELRRRALATLVGERTAGAVLVADFAPLSEEAVLMLPVARLSYSAALEGSGVAPDVPCRDPLPATPGADPILWAGLQTLEGMLNRSTLADSR
ncbi:MAG: S41 family peptidase [Planctomycetota bacterium]|nr:S41 family peptidase [Planctomycetota bacterium]